MVPDLSFWSCWVSRTQQLQKLKSGTILMLGHQGCSSARAEVSPEKTGSDLFPGRRKGKSI
jgi:hypothetical protein